MFTEIPPTLALLAGGSVFILIVCVWGAAVILWNLRTSKREDNMARRLAPDDAIRNPEARVLRLWHEGDVRTTTIMEDGASYKERLETMRRLLGWKMPLATFLMGLVGMCLLTFVVSYGLTSNLGLAIMLPVVLILILRGVAQSRASKEAELFEQQLAEALGLATRSLRAGHPLLSAFGLIVAETDAPVRDVFADIVQQQELGKSLEEALRETSLRCGSSDMKLFTASMTIQLRSGGNVADMMERLIEVIRDRIRLRRRARVLTAQTVLSKRILMGVPILLFAYLYLVKPDYLTPLFTTNVGHYLLVMAVGGLVLGSWVMDKIAELKY